MKHYKLKTLISTVALAALTMASNVHAQAGKVSASDLKFDTLQSPEVGGNTGRKSWKPKDWLEAEVKIEIEMPKSYKHAFVDSVTVKWFVAVDNPDGNGVLLLEKEVEHVNFPVGEEVYSSVYLSPAAIERISGSDRASKTMIKAIGGEVLVNGTSLPDDKGRYFTEGQKLGWWTSGSLSRYDRVPLLNKNETPFKFLWWDRYAEIKPERR
ncbi:Amuc_1102 family pilus-like protein [Rubritalea spongiae]|uniref:Amuc_1102 family pilus-like protein n=1 Tax=Rubritalea spongiae TaxID=430797 RepID=A0ABW5E1A0_9BACT